MKIVITTKASDQLLKLFSYLESSFSAKVRRDFQQKLDRKINTIKAFPEAFPASCDKKHKKVCGFFSNFNLLPN